MIELGIITNQSEKLMITLIDLEKSQPAWHTGFRSYISSFRSSASEIKHSYAKSPEYPQYTPLYPQCNCTECTLNCKTCQSKFSCFVCEDGHVQRKYLGSCTDYPETSVACQSTKRLFLFLCDSSPKLRTCDIVINAKGIWVVSLIDCYSSAGNHNEVTSNQKR